MDDTVKTAAEARTAEALAAGPWEDFREAYRERLRWLKEARPQAFAEAVAAYDKLVADVAAGADALGAWLGYGRQLGELSGRGRVVGIDRTGRAGAADHAGDHLLLHLPDDINVPALALGIPRAATAAQKSTLDLLVRRKLSLE